MKIETKTVKSSIRASWRLRLKVWWWRKRHPREAAIADEISRRFEEAVIFGEGKDSDRCGFCGARRDADCGIWSDGLAADGVGSRCRWNENDVIR